MPEKYSTGWEDGECASVKELICSCGTNLLEGEGEDLIVNHEDITKCPKCGKVYQFIWMGMIVKELTNA